MRFERGERGYFQPSMIEESDTARFGAAASSCRAAVFFSSDPGRPPFFAAYCRCGWHGSPVPTRKRALREARSHSPQVSDEVRGLEAKDVPDALRPESPAKTEARRSFGDDEGIVRIMTRAPHSFRRVEPPEGLAPGGTS